MVISQKQFSLHVYRAVHNIATSFTPFIDIVKEVDYTMQFDKDADELAQGIHKALNDFVRLRVIVERNNTYCIYNDSLRRRHMSSGNFAPVDSSEDASDEDEDEDEAPKRPQKEDKPTTSKKAKANNKATKPKGKSQISARKSQISARKLQISARKSQISGRQSQISDRQSQISGRQSQISGRKSKPRSKASNYGKPAKVAKKSYKSKKDNCFFDEELENGSFY